jgi:hypothetical protein
MSLVNQVQLLAQRIAAECTDIRTQITDTTGDLAALTTTDKTNLVGAVNELKTLIDQIDATDIIDDTTVGTDTTFSSQKITDDINVAIAGLVDGAPGALDTLNELAAALGDNESAIATITNGLANRLRIDALQTLTAQQQEFGRTNLDVYSKAEIGDIDTDFVAVFESGL